MVRLPFSQYHNVSRTEAPSTPGARWPIGKLSPADRAAILFWGIPTGVLTAIEIERSNGVGSANYLSGHFAIRLGLGILVTGVLGGIAFSRAFGWAMRLMFGPRR